MRITTHTDGTQRDEVRYDRLSRLVTGERFGEAVRTHWGESMHRGLDVTCRVEQSRTRERMMANTLSWVRGFAVTLLKRHPVEDRIRGKMIRRLAGTQLLDQVQTLQGDRYALAVQRG